MVSTAPATRTKEGRRRLGLFECCGLLLAVILVDQLYNQSRQSTITTTTTANAGTIVQKDDGFPYTCSFRDDYTRFYGLTEDDYPKPFLRTAIYIHGKPPMVLPLSSSSDSSDSSEYGNDNNSTTTTTNKNNSNNGGKVCFKPSPKHLRQAIKNKTTGERDTLFLDRPIMDGKNPSLISVQRLEHEILIQQQQRVHHDTNNNNNNNNNNNASTQRYQQLIAWKRFLLDTYPTAAYLVSSTMKRTNQCNHNDDNNNINNNDNNNNKKKQKKEYTILNSQRLPGRRYNNEVDLLLVDEQFQTLWQTTVLTKNFTTTMNDNYDDNKNNNNNNNNNNNIPVDTFTGDDARLIVHDGAVYLTFKRYGGQQQRGNGSALYVAKLELQMKKKNNNNNKNVQQHASFDFVSVREWAMCCGRNFMALSNDHPIYSSSSSSPSSSSSKRRKQSTTSNSILRFLTIPDPILVGSFDTSTPNTSIVGLEQPSYRSKSHFHGTSGFMLYLPETEEYLGVGHIHREQKWSKNVDAHFGHHYTHAFFTIKKVVEETVTGEAEEEEQQQQQQQSSSSSSQSLPYELTRVSQEFLFPSKVKPNDADIIQFASGLEWVYSRSTNTQTTTTTTTPSESRQKIAISYGINDCEGAVVYVDWDTVEKMLIPVPSSKEGFQVIHTMTNMTREAFSFFPQ